jgi:hypothetical protein
MIRKSKGSRATPDFTNTNTGVAGPYRTLARHESVTAAAAKGASWCLELRECHGHGSRLTLAPQSYIMAMLINWAMINPMATVAKCQAIIQTHRSATRLN